jgi:hypothetical protein
MLSDRVLLLANSVKDFFVIVNSFQEGSIFLNAGNHAIEIKTKHKPEEVWVSIRDAGFMQVCQGDLDKVGYTVSDGGFILYADVVSDSVIIDWNVLFAI